MDATFDSHCHVHDFEDAGEALERGRSAGVEGVVAVGTDLAASARAVGLAGDHGDVWASVGLHPHDASRFAEEWEGLEELARRERVVAVGETGFDLHYRHSGEAEQEEAFRAHLALARRLDLTLVIHTREAWAETFAVLDEVERPERVVFHCFTGGPDEARRALAFGAWLSFSGIVTFKGADDVRAAAALAPGDRLLAETDAPYLTPVPHRGSRNEPRHLVDVVAGLAAARGESAEDVARSTTANARRAFALP